MSALRQTVLLCCASAMATTAAADPALWPDLSGARADGGLLRFDARDDLLAAGRGLGVTVQFEDFERGHVRFLPQTEFASCTEPVSHASDDACFAPGDLVAGFSVNSSNRFGVIQLGIDLLDIDSPGIGAWPYRLSPISLNYTRLDFDHGPTVIAADVYGFKIENGSATGQPVPVLVEAFDHHGALIGSFEVTPSTYNVPAFAGFFSPVPVASVQYGTRVEIAGAMVDNLHFGGGPGRAQISAQQLDFGAVAAGALDVAPLEIDNAGALPLTLPTLQAPPAPFALADDGCSGTTLAPGAQCTVWISFEPGYRDDFSAELVVPGDGSQAAARVRLQGTGIWTTGGGL